MPRAVRWRFRLESGQVLPVSVSVVGGLGGWETFHGRMERSFQYSLMKCAFELTLLCWFFAVGELTIVSFR